MENDDVRKWWSTSVSRTEPNVIEYRGYPIQELIGEIGFVDTIWLLVIGELPSAGQRRLLEAAMMSAADHGPQAPSIATARMAATCGVGLNSAVASAVNVLGDVHGGAGQQCVELLQQIQAGVRDGGSVDGLAREAIESHKQRGTFIPGFGHRFHQLDPRRDPLVRLLQLARDAGEISGDYLSVGLALEQALSAGSKSIPMNIDGATAIIYAELGLEPEMARGMFVLSRSVGILAHAWEEKQGGRRIKGPMPPSMTAPFAGQTRHYES